MSETKECRHYNKISENCSHPQKKGLTRSGKCEMGWRPDCLGY